MPLGQIAEDHHDHGSQDFCHGGIKMEFFHKQFQEDVIEQDANGNHHDIANQLNPPAQNRIMEYDMPHQHESDGECNHKGNEKSTYMRADRYVRQVNYLFVEYKMITDKIKHDIQ